jgi:tape measure domain-containing protein
MGSQANLLARISADSTPFTRAIGEVNTALDKAFQKAQASSRGFQALGQTLSGLGSSLTLGVTAPMLALGAASIKAATDIDSLKRGLTTVTGSAAATEVEFRKLRETAKLPGIDFEQAVRGSIRLQTLGVSADKARVIMGNFGNALAAAGGTKADFGEIVRQLSQLSSAATVTKENLDPIIDRVPAVAAIIREKFGPAALGDPAKTFQALGISSQQLVDILTTELGNRVPKITGSAQSAFDSFSEAVNEAAGRLGEKLLPSVTATLPKLEALIGSAADAVDTFTQLPGPIQNTAIALGTLLIAIGPITAAVGRLVAAGAALKGFATTAVGAIGAAGSLVGLGAGAAIAVSIKNLGELEQRYKVLDETTARVGKLGKATAEFAVPAFLQLGTATKQVTAEVGKVPEVAGAATTAIERFTAVTVSSYAEDFKTAVLKERLSLLTSDYSKRLSDGVSALVRYGSAAAAANAALTELRITEEAPSIGGGPITDVRRLPTPNVPGLPGGAVLDGADAARSSQRNLDLIRRTAQGATAAWGTARQQISRQVSTITTDFSRAVADIITGASSAGEAFKRLGQSVAQSLIRTIVENGVNVAIKALGNLLSSLGGVGKAIGGIFSGGSSAAGSIGGSAGGASGGLGGAVGAASGGVTAVVGAVAGVASAISGIVGNFQMKAINQTLDLLERETRIIRSLVESNVNQINRYLPFLEAIHQRLIEFRNVGVKIEGGGGGSTVVNITVQGSLIGGPNVAAELSQMVVRNLKLQGV